MDKILYLVRGIPGSGKSYLAKQIGLGGAIFSTDDFFMVNGEYKFNPSQIGRAHQWNQERAKNAMQSGITPIVIDNTNVQAWQMKFYVEEARKNGYKIEIKEPETSWKFDAEELAKRNQHGVPKSTIERMIGQWEKDISVDDIINSKNPFEKKAAVNNEDSEMAYKNYCKNIEMAQDPNTSPEILKKIIESASTHEDTYAVMCAVKNPNCPVEVLEKVIRRGETDITTIWAVNNKKCPPYLLKEILERGDNSLVSRHVAANPKCPPEALVEVLERGMNDDVSWIAADNPNCPVSALEMVLKRGKDDAVSVWAAENKNCPIKSKIQWMQATGRIGKEDPSKHIIEREEIKEDPDLQKLRDLIAKNKNWYKKAQENKEDYYTEEIAKDPNTSPEILKKILEQGEYDGVSCSAASNPNCPVSALEMVLKRGSKNSISCYAAENPNCPVYLLEEILKRGENDSISYSASLNPNCPIYLLEMVLKRGKDDLVSRYASENPNCPALAKIEWMRSVGRIGKEDPSKHIIEREEIKEDEDLQKLRDLIAKNKNWYKKAQENYYTSEIASSPNTSPEILKKILEQGNSDYVSRYAAKNPNCPAYLLEMVLKRGKDDSVSWNAASNLNCTSSILEMVLNRGKDDYVSSYAVRNPNCPALALEMVLKRGKDDGVSLNAAENPNCPASALEMVLKRGKDDGVSRGIVSRRNINCPAYLLEMVLKRGKDDDVSYYASKNSNCPALAKIRWMQSVGIIGKEDPSKHIIEREEIKEDEDLQKLRDLIANNKNWYKKAKLVDAGESSGDNAKNHPSCMVCGRFATHPTQEKVDPNQYVWKKQVELDEEELEASRWAGDVDAAEKYKRAITHNLCPICLKVMYKYFGYPQKFIATQKKWEEVKQKSLQEK